MSGNGTPSVTFQPAGYNYDPVVLTVTVFGGSNSKTATATVQIGSQPGSPTFVGSNNEDLLNTVSLHPGDTVAVSTGFQTNVTFDWKVSGGTIQSGQGTNAVTLVAGAIGTMSVSCDAISQIGLMSSSSATVPVFDPAVAPPTVTTITGPNSCLLAGSTGMVFTTPAQSGCTYAWGLWYGSFNAFGNGPYWRSFHVDSPCAGQGASQTIFNTPHIGGGGGDTGMGVRVVVSNAGSRVVISHGLALI